MVKVTPQLLINNSLDALTNRYVPRIWDLLTPNRKYLSPPLQAPSIIRMRHQRDVRKRALKMHVYAAATMPNTECVPLNHSQLLRYGVPLSFVYCTIYQQDIWREGDEKLSSEQQRVWRDFFSIVDEGFTRTKRLMNMTSDSESNSKSKFLAMYDSMDFKTCYNSKVAGTFAAIDNIVSDPKATACKIYRKVQPYITSQSPPEEKKSQS